MPFRFAVAVAASLHAAAALAGLWAYVDEQGRSHVADRQIDSRYRLFYKGKTSLDVRNAAAETRAQAIDALAGTRLYERATNPAVTQRFAPLIEQAARANKLDPALVKAVVAAESGFDPRAVSDKGAIGLMQVLPGTAERYGVAGSVRRSTAEKLEDPATNLRIGTRYLHDLLARFDGRLPLALAAYNAGEGTVDAHEGGVPRFRETRDYVRVVQQLYAIYRPQPAGPVRIVAARDPVRAGRAYTAGP